MRTFPIVTSIAALCLACCVSIATWAQDPSTQETKSDERDATPRFHGTTDVMGSRVADSSAAAGRREIVLTRAEIAELPVASTQDLLTYLPGVGMARRGARGVQGDLNMRGGTFEQALLLVNGLRVNNSQTGHHNLDLFIPLAAIERVELLYGPGSSVYGPDAFGGAINIITGTQENSAHFRVGENNLTGGGFTAVLGGGAWVAAEREVHTGFRDNTEAQGNQFIAGWSRSSESFTLDLAVSGGYRHFGAHAFYSARFPDERERTEGRSLTANASMPLGAQTSLRLGLRVGRHEDDFILDRNRPEWYRNIHQTDAALLNAVATGSVHGIDWATGFETSRDEIDSSNLGRHDRQRSALFAEVGKFGGPTTLSLQARTDQQNPWGRVTTFGAGGSQKLGSKAILRAHYGQSFRAPSFTELHYVSPSRMGNPDLEPERGWTAEIGLDIGPLGLTVFHRQSRSLIDYVLDDDGIWQASNLGGATTRGIELGLMLPATGSLRWQRASVVYLDSEIDVDPDRSAYALAHPRLELTWTGALALGEKWTAGWGGRFREPTDGDSWATLDLRLERRILKTMTISVEASNLFDREITELHGVPLPGRWVTATLHYRGGSSP
ncbi:MAG: TonB-dependent receptor [bacterium]|nr:TonB-dependent receptor [bacterium]